MSLSYTVSLVYKCVLPKTAGNVIVPQGEYFGTTRTVPVHHIAKSLAILRIVLNLGVEVQLSTLPQVLYPVPWKITLVYFHCIHVSIVLISFTVHTYYSTNRRRNHVNSSWK